MRLCSLFLGSVMACVFGNSGVGQCCEPLPAQRNVMGDIQKMEHVYERVGKEVVIEGKAENTKMGAVVIGNDFGVYLDGVESWPENAYGKKVRAKGVLRRYEQVGDPKLVQGCGPVIYVIENPKWEIIKGAN